MEKAALVEEIRDLVAEGAAVTYPFVCREIRSILRSTDPGTTLMDRFRAIEEALDALDEAYELEGVKQP